VFTLSGTTPRGPASAEFIHRSLAGVRRHRTVAVPLPPPFGERRCPGFAEVDAGWLGGIAEGRIVRCYLCIAEPARHECLLGLNCSGAMATLPRDWLRTQAQPAGAVGHEPVAHWVAAKRRGRRLAARTVQCQGDFVHAAASTVMFADALRAGRPRGGCFDPGELFRLAELESELRESGIWIIERH
jgi:hypothetical protein